MSDISYVEEPAFFFRLDPNDLLELMTLLTSFPQADATNASSLLIIRSLEPKSDDEVYTTADEEEEEQQQQQVVEELERVSVVDLPATIRQEVTILVAGASGVGKTNLINSIFNYISRETLEKAEIEGILTKLSSHFNVFTGEEMENVVITGDDKDNEETIECKECTLYYKDTNFKFVDTPGYGMSPEKDAIITEMLIPYTEKNKIDAICFVMKPNESRLDTSFIATLRKLITIMDNTNIKNIILCFTHTRNTFYKPGDTFPVLRRQIREGNNKNFIFDKEHIYCFENEAFRYLATFRNEKIQYCEKERESFQESWDHSIKETKRMLEYLITLNQTKLRRLIN